MPSIAKTYYLSGRVTPIDIKENSGNNLSNYAVMIQLTSSWDGWSYVKSDGSDIYFTDANGNPLYFWIETWDCTNKKAVIWVKVPSIPANSTVRIYMRYGGSNPYVSYRSGDGTFLFFDDFLGSSLDTSKWVSLTGSGGSVSVSNSMVKLDRANIVTKTWQITDGIIEYRGYSASKEISCIARASTNSSFDVFTASGVQGGHGYYTDSSTPSWSHAITVADTIKASVASPITINKWYKYRFILNGVNLRFMRFDDNWNLEADVSYTDTGGLTKGYIGLRVNGSGNGDRVAYYDWVRVRPYANPEPSVTINPSITSKLLDLM